MFPQNPLMLDFSIMRLFQRETHTWELVVATLPPLSTAPVTLRSSHTLGRAADLLISSPSFLSYHPALQARLTGSVPLQRSIWPLAAGGRAAVICRAEQQPRQRDNGTDLMLCLCGPSPLPKPGDSTARNMERDSAGPSEPGHRLLMLTAVSPSIPQLLVMLTFNGVEEINPDTQI